MEYYTVSRIGSGKRGDGFRPDYSGGSFLWAVDNPCPYCGLYILIVPEGTEIDSLKKITDLETACTIRGLEYEDILAWFVGD